MFCAETSKQTPHLHPLTIDDDDGDGSIGKRSFHLCDCHRELGANEFIRESVGGLCATGISINKCQSV